MGRAAPRAFPLGGGIAVSLQPWDPERLEVKRLGARWDPARRVWWLPPQALDRLEAACPRVELHPDLKRMYPPRSLAGLEEFRDEVSVPGLRGELFPFQRRGVTWIERCGGRALLADEPGLGKTVQALAWLQLHPEARPVLVVCPAVVRGNWAEEARRWLEPGPGNEVTEIRTGRDRPGAGITICTYDLAHALPADYRPRAVVLDECHYIKSPSARRTKAVAALGREAQYVVALSGTPMLNRPAELFTTLNLLRQDLWPSRRAFEVRYCGGHLAQIGFRRFWRADGATNIPELALKLREVMLRRRKEDVLSELPAKTRQVVRVPLDALPNAAEYRRAEEDFAAWLMERGRDRPKGAALLDVARALEAEALVKLGVLRRLAGAGKVEHALRWAEDFLEGSDLKLVVFAHHREVQEALFRGLERFGAVRLAPGADYAREAARFQSGDARVAVCSLRAAGQGVTLTAASHMLLCELDWTPAILEQAEDRIHRVGQASACTYTYLVASGTVDEDMLDALRLKRNVVRRAVDDQSSS